MWVVLLPVMVCEMERNGLDGNDRKRKPNDDRCLGRNNSNTKNEQTFAVTTYESNAQSAESEEVEVTPEEK